MREWEKKLNERKRENRREKWFCMEKYGKLRENLYRHIRDMNWKDEYLLLFSYICWFSLYVEVMSQFWCEEYAWKLSMNEQGISVSPFNQTTDYYHEWFFVVVVVVPNEFFF